MKTPLIVLTPQNMPMEAPFDKPYNYSNGYVCAVEPEPGTPFNALDDYEITIYYAYNPVYIRVTQTGTSTTRTGTKNTKLTGTSTSKTTKTTAKLPNDETKPPVTDPPPPVTDPPPPVTDPPPPVTDPPPENPEDDG